MGLTLRIVIGLMIFFVGTFIVTWAIREGGNFDFLHPRRWRKRATGSSPRPEDRRP